MPQNCSIDEMAFITVMTFSFEKKLNTFLTISYEDIGYGHSFKSKLGLIILIYL